MIGATCEDAMSLPALCRSSPRIDKGKRVYGSNVLAASDWPGRRSSLLQNQAYAQQFDSAAGSHTEAHGPSSVRVYTDRDKLYDGLAGRPCGLQGPPAPYNTPRRRFPGAGVSQVDLLLRNGAKPLTSEHPSEYGELYSGAAGAPKHWLLGTRSTVAPRYRTQPVGPGPSQVDEVVLGHDIDRSTELTQLLLDGAAGVKSIGASPRVEARRHIPGGGESQVDELIWGSDVDNSSDPLILQAKAQLFEGAAGGTLLCKQPGRRNIPGGGESQVDELIWGSDVDNSSDPLILQAKAQLFEGAAGTLPMRIAEGRRQVDFNRHSAEDASMRGRRHHPSPRDRVGPLLEGVALPEHSAHRGAYHVGMASRVDDVMLHRDIDGSTQQYCDYAELTSGAAGRRYVGAGDRAEGKRHIETADSLVKEVFSPTAEHEAQRPARRHIPGGTASLFDDVVLHRDIDGSAQQFRDYAELTAGAAGRRCVGSQEPRSARRHIAAGTASQVDEVLLHRDMDSAKQQRFLEFEEANSGAAGRRCVGRHDRVEGKRHIESASMMKELLREE